MVISIKHEVHCSPIDGIALPTQYKVSNEGRKYCGIRDLLYQGTF